MGVMESGSDGARRHAEDLGDRGGLISEVVAKDEDRALLGFEPSEPSVHDVTVHDTLKLVGRRVTVDVQDLQLRVPASITPGVLDAHVREHSLDPEVEPFRIAEVRQVAPGDHQRVLQSILGPVDISKDPPGDGEQAIDAPAQQVDECDLVPSLRCDHEFSIHRRLSFWTPPSGTSSDGSGGWCARSVGKWRREAVNGSRRVGHAYSPGLMTSDCPVIDLPQTRHRTEEEREMSTFAGTCRTFAAIPGMRFQHLWA